MNEHLLIEITLFERAKSLACCVLKRGIKLNCKTFYQSTTQKLLGEITFNYMLTFDGKKACSIIFLMFVCLNVFYLFIDTHTQTLRQNYLLKVFVSLRFHAISLLVKSLAMPSKFSAS